MNNLLGVQLTQGRTFRQNAVASKQNRLAGNFVYGDPFGIRITNQSPHTIIVYIVVDRKPANTVDECSTQVGYSILPGQKITVCEFYHNDVTRGPFVLTKGGTGIEITIHHLLAEQVFELTDEIVTALRTNPREHRLGQGSKVAKYRQQIAVDQEPFAQFSFAPG